MSIPGKGLLDSINGFIDRLQKWPLLGALVLTVSHSVWMTLVTIRVQDLRVQDAKDATYSIKLVSDEAIRQAREKDVLKDSIISMKTREFQNLIDKINR